MSKRLSIDDFRISLDLPVQWGDMDAFQHVNNARFFRFFESARVHYFHTTGLGDYFAGSSLSFILAKAGCTYIAPLTYPDSIAVGCRTVRITPSHLEQQYLIHSSKLQTAAALGTASIVAFDYESMHKAEFPPRLLDIISRHEGLEVESAG
ncbi:acyl-CoA thioesterase [Desulfovermiculus halophilus]|jgi:acyl-CoA thioester hydrolase|uniref:acyl-CoA thioesterase n=1 Tax=Desulfovermiculus halophilus TaxID=339722 RepID=UPI0005525295|nr:thioesterase family protein [Desulfovermiculus halophilus]